MVDFGIAALAPDESKDPQPAQSAPMNMLGSRLTKTGALLGTPAYMSPEQFAGERATAASDQWSFCVALYRSVYGISPYSQGDVEQIAYSVVHDPPLPPARRPEVPAWLAPILLRGLQKDAAARFCSMADLLLAIENHLPPDLELDPTRMVRERQLLSVLAITGFFLISLPLLSDSVARLLTRPVSLIGVPGGVLFVILGTIGLKWRQLFQNRYGRRLAGLFPGIFTAALLQGVIAFLLGLPMAHMIVEEMLVMAVFIGLMGLLHEAWVGWPAAICAMAAVVGAAVPRHVPIVLCVSVLLSLCTFVLRVFVDRHLDPAAAVGVQKSSEDPRPSAGS